MILMMTPATLLSIAIFLAPLYLLLGLLYLYRWYRRRKGLRTPLTRPLLRTPGESLRNRIQEATDAIFEGIFVVAVFPSLIGGIFLVQAYISGRRIESSLLVGVIIWFIFTAYFVIKIFRILPRRRDLRLGLQGELAVAEELNRLMLNGYHVYHDLPAEKFNIDHIVVGKSGVFAVETKTRSKRKTGRGQQDAEVTYDGRRLQFPGGYDENAISQTVSQAIWLQNWLSSAVGEKIATEPILTLPGWFVKRIKPDGIPVLNAKEIPKFIMYDRKPVLSDSMITRITHQIDQRCRDVDPMEPLP
jgi:hypothetical protein